MNDRAEPLSIGQLSRRTGLPVRTIRFWSDSGLLEPARRSAGGHRLYDAEAVARLELIQTLRELGLGLETVRRVLHRQVTVSEVARTHADALDVEIRALRLRRAVLRSVARRASTTEEMRLMHELARLSARERQRMIDDFVDRAFEGLDPEAPGAYIAQAMRLMPAELPADPSAEQVDAWIELAELVSDEGFLRRVRRMVLLAMDEDFQRRMRQEMKSPPGGYDHDKIMEHAGGALAAGVAPDSPEGRRVLDRIVDPALPAGERLRIADTLEAFTDRRVERYWQLMVVLNGRPPFPPMAPACEWFTAALRAHL
ncbi:MerR family transcriptional regulator [Planomonospora alba]|uniref:MerR family transcriptional regulator n=1 Tax=Planomonospora alba TaxID=161354 RepID=A0ABP6MXH6_9ACTN